MRLTTSPAEELSALGAWVEPDGNPLNVTCENDYDHGPAVVLLCSGPMQAELCGACAMAEVGRMTVYELSGCEAYVVGGAR